MLTVVFNDDKEYEKLKNDAYEHKMNISQFIRYLVAKERELTNEIERIRRREKRTTISEREKEAFEYFVAKEYCDRYSEHIRTPQNDEVRE